VQEQVIQRSILLAYFRENEIYISVIRDALYFPFVHRAKDEGLASFSMTQQLFIYINKGIVHLNGGFYVKPRHRLHGRGFQSTRFHDLETASKTTRFRSVYTEPM